MATHGRTPPALPEVTLPDSGYTVQIRGLGPYTIQRLNEQAQKAHPAPKPPMASVSLMGAEPRLQPNEADPDYLAALIENRLQVNIEASRLLIEQMADYAVETEIDAELLAKFRKSMTKRGIELPDDDALVWLTHIVISSGRDLDALRDAVLRQSQPTEAAISDKLEQFQRPVQGS